MDFPQKVSQLSLVQIDSIAEPRTMRPTVRVEIRNVNNLDRVLTMVFWGQAAAAWDVRDTKKGAVGPFFVLPG
jgi:hypothetical protein